LAGAASEKSRRVLFSSPPPPKEEESSLLSSDSRRVFTLRLFEIFSKNFSRGYTPHAPPSGP